MALSSHASERYHASQVRFSLTDVRRHANCSGVAAVDGPKENRAAIINEEGWEEWLLELLLDGSPCIPSAEEQASHF